MVAIADLHNDRERILEIAITHGARNVRVFGSVARGESRDGSDVDLLVHFDPDRSLIDQAALTRELEDLLGCRVEVVSDVALHERIRDRVLAEGVAL